MFQISTCSCGSWHVMRPTTASHTSSSMVTTTLCLMLCSPQMANLLCLHHGMDPSDSGILSRELSLENHLRQNCGIRPAYIDDFSCQCNKMLHLWSMIYHEFAWLMSQLIYWQHILPYWTISLKTDVLATTMKWLTRSWHEPIRIQFSWAFHHSHARMSNR